MIIIAMIGHFGFATDDVYFLIMTSYYATNGDGPPFPFTAGAL